MIRTKISAVTSVTYGLLSALIIAVIVGSLSAAGVGVENVFSAAGNGIAATMAPPFYPLSTPNPALTAEQQSQITNAAAEIAAGTASTACLQYMNNNGSTMASNNATCLGPGNGIAPPALPVAFEANGWRGDKAVEPNGIVYAAIFMGDGGFSATSATAAAGSYSIIEYGDGYEFTGGEFNPTNDVPECQSAGFLADSSGTGTPTVINGNELVCAEPTALPGQFADENNPSTTAPLGYKTPW